MSRTCSLGVPIQIREKYETWKDIVAHSGPQGPRGDSWFQRRSASREVERLSLVASQPSVSCDLPNRARSDVCHRGKDFEA